MAWVGIEALKVGFSNRLAKQDSSNNIDKILAMDDAELGVKVLKGEIPRPHHK